MGRVRVRVGAICVICRGEGDYRGKGRLHRGGVTIKGRGDIRGEG